MPDGNRGNSNLSTKNRRHAPAGAVKIEHRQPHSSGDREHYLPIMEQWQVGPVPEYVYTSNPTNQQHGMHGAHGYQVDMSRRDDRLPFQYGPGPTAQHHGQPVQQPLNVPQPAQQGQGQAQTPQQQQQQLQQQQQQLQQQQQAATTPAPAPAQRGRKRAAPPPPTPAAPVAPQPTPASAAPVAPIPSPAPPQAPAPAPVAQVQQPPQQPTAQPVGDDSGMMAAPPAKKSRTNTPWTPQEEQRLKVMRDQNLSWAEIAKTFPNRTEGSVKKHWYKDMHYAEFAEDESQALLHAIKDYESNKWKAIGTKVGKPAKACEQYAKEHFPELFNIPTKGR